MLEPYAGHFNNLQVILANCSNRFGHLLKDNLGMEYEVTTPDKVVSVIIPDYFPPHEHVEEIARNNAIGVAKDHSFLDLRSHLLLLVLIQLL
ncbi:hypothetical protein TNCV_727541 [Trichonephila clavipes]|nr:hypothetical protein TNCV_727541 [Trichonephila clavipes]